jgi:hypothetical protein
MGFQAAFIIYLNIYSATTYPIQVIGEPFYETKKN